MSAYIPTSGCGHGCLPRADSVPRVGLPRQFARVTALALVLLGGMAVAAAVPVLTKKGRAQAVRGWFRAVVRAAGVRIHTDRSALSVGGATLIASNHVSWLDIPTVLAIEPMRVLAKSDVRGWPVIGILAARGGTLFIDRQRLRRLPATIAEIAQSMRDGESVLVFPEGSTWCGRTQGRFYPATFQSAIDADAPVQPIALRYRLADGSTTTAAAFVGDDTLLAAVWRVAGTRGLSVELIAGPALSVTERNRRELAQESAATILGDRAIAPVSTTGAVRSEHAGPIHH